MSIRMTQHIRNKPRNRFYPNLQQSLNYYKFNVVTLTTQKHWSNYRWNLYINLKENVFIHPLYNSTYTINVFHFIYVICDRKAFIFRHSPIIMFICCHYFLRFLVNVNLIFTIGWLGHLYENGIGFFFVCVR